MPSFNNSAYCRDTILQTFKAIQRAIFQFRISLLKQKNTSLQQSTSFKRPFIKAIIMIIYNLHQQILQLHLLLEMFFFWSISLLLLVSRKKKDSTYFGPKLEGTFDLRIFYCCYEIGNKMSLRWFESRNEQVWNILILANWLQRLGHKEQRIYHMMTKTPQQCKDDLSHT